MVFSRFNPYTHMNHDNKILLVTGGTGMVGRQIIKYAIASGFKIICPTRNPNKQTPSDDIIYIHADYNEPAFQDAAIWKDIIKTYNVTHICEAAGRFDGAPEKLRIVNYTAPKALSEAAEQTNIQRYIQITSYNMNNEHGNIIWDQYRELHDYLKTERRKLNWVEVAPTHIYASRPGESHIPYHLMAAAKYHLDLDPDTLMQPIHVHDLAKGVVNLCLNDKATHQRLPALGSEVLPHNDFLNEIQHAMGIPGESKSFKLSHSTALKLAALNEWIHKHPNINLFAAFTPSTTHFNLRHSVGDFRPFESAGEIKLDKIYDHFQEDSRILLHDISSHWKSLFRVKLSLPTLGKFRINTGLMHRFDPYLNGKISVFSASEWRVFKNGIVRFTYEPNTPIPDVIIDAQQLLARYYSETNLPSKTPASLGPCFAVDRLKHGETCRQLLTMDYRDLKTMVLLLTELSQQPDWTNEEKQSENWPEIKQFIQKSISTTKAWQR